MKESLEEKQQIPPTHIIGGWKESDLVALVISRLADCLKGVGHIREERRLSEGAGPDAVLRCRVGGDDFRFIVQARRYFWPRDVLQAIGAFSVWKKDFPEHQPIVVGELVPQSSRRLLREQGVAYFDLRGNAWVKFGPVLLDRELPDPRTINRPEQSAPMNRLVSRKSSRLLRVLLEDRETTWTLPALSRAAKVSLGLTWQVTRRLTHEGWMEKRRGAIRLIAPGNLLDFWAQHYDFTRHTAYRFYAPIRSLDELVERLSQHLAGNKYVQYAFTGPAGALLVAPYVRFATYHMYVSGRRPADGDIKIQEQDGAVRGRELLVGALDLRPVDQGGANVVLLEPHDEGVFDRLQYPRNISTVCNTQLYLDLVTYPGRGREQAAYLREQVMKI